MKILIAVDGSVYTKHMLAYIAAHDEFLGPNHDYTALNVSAALPPRAGAIFDREMLKTYHEDECERVFKPIRAFFSKQGIGAKFITKVGKAGEVIARTADSGKFDLLIMGSHGHGALGNLVLGSVSNRVIAHCNTPVLLVR